MTTTPVFIVGGAASWMEGEALHQLEQAAALPGMIAAVGLPDLHPGRGPVGAALASEGILYPYLVGNDIGCGMALWQTAIPRRKAGADRIVKRLKGLEGPWQGDLAPWREAHQLEPSGWDTALGTVGGGNHFAEFQTVHRIVDPESWAAADLDEEALFLLIHSGSRGLGESILRAYVAKHGAAGVAADGEEGHAYRREHDRALRWAAANRAVIATRFMEACPTEGRRVLDLTHNSVTSAQVNGRAVWLHRKGAAPATEALAVIPGSRGAYTYLVRPTGDQEANLYSIAHGAGRKWNRTSAKDRLKERYSAAQLVQTKLGGHVICEDKDLLFEEAPEAYKNIDTVVEILENAGLIRTIALLKPIVTYKVRREGE